MLTTTPKESKIKIYVEQLSRNYPNLWKNIQYAICAVVAIEAIIKEYS